MKKENLYKLSEYFTKENDSFAENLRYNLDICLKPLAFHLTRLKICCIRTQKIANCPLLPS